MFGTAAEAIEQSTVPDAKVTKPYASFKGLLTLGDQVRFQETAMSINVERYFRTHPATAPTASSFFSRTNGTQSSSETAHSGTNMFDDQDGSNLETIKTGRNYVVFDVDGSLPGGKKNVTREDLAKGYEYGRTAVHVTESDENVVKLDTKQSFEIIGFIPNNTV